MLLHCRKVISRLVESSCLTGEPSPQFIGLGADAVHLTEIGEGEHSLEAVTGRRDATCCGVIAGDPEEQGADGRRRRILIELLQRPLVVIPGRV